MEDAYLTKKALISDIKLAIYFATILIGITLTYASTTFQLTQNTDELQSLVKELKTHNEQQITMQREVDGHEIRITYLEDKSADRSAAIK